MLKKIRQQVLVLPILFSLILLGGLLTYWLIGEYNQVKRVVSMEDNLDKMVMYIKDLSSIDSLNLPLDKLNLHSLTGADDKLQYVFKDSQEAGHIQQIRVIKDQFYGESSIKLKIFDSIPMDHEMSVIQEIVDGNWSKNLGVEKSVRYYLSKIALQISFAVLLFLSTLIAFYLIWKSWLKEKQLTRFRDDFISNISHELKTPMNTIGVAIEAIDSFNVSNDPALMKEYISISKSELERLNSLVDKAIAIDVPDKEALGSSMQKVDLKNELDKLISIYQIKFTKDSGQLLFKNSGSNFFVLANSIHLQNVFYNLLDNALKYRSEKEICVEINLQEKDQTLEIRINDNGIGIDKTYHKSIFKKFFRVPQDNRHNVKGYGLGLNYVQKIIDLHDGKIRVESEDKAGSCFIISLPKSKNENNSN